MNKLKTRVSVAMTIVLAFGLLSCQHKQAKAKTSNPSSPYQVFYNNITLPQQVTDTILVQLQTRVFGCGTAAMAYYDELQSSGLDKFYERHGDVLSDSMALETFVKKNKTRIIWVTRGLEGEACDLADSALHADRIFEKRMFVEKCFIKIVETPQRMDKVTIEASVAYPLSKTVFRANYQLTEQDKTWKIENTQSAVTADTESFEQAYYP